jgi:formylglycine-generating enzyme required for sulfatase activity
VNTGDLLRPNGIRIVHRWFEANCKMSVALRPRGLPEESGAVTHVTPVNAPFAALCPEPPVFATTIARLARVIRSRPLRLAGLLAAVVGIAWANAFAGDSAPPPSITIDLQGVPMEFVLVRAGTFLMGSSESVGGDDESPARRVTISRDFYLGKYEITQAQWEKVMHANPSGFRGTDRPVEKVSWDDCQVFLKKLAALTGRRFALPTEAQWEFACRAGTTSRWSFGDDEAQLSKYAWYGANAGGETHPVGTRQPNATGLYDMHGNVGEWTADAYEKHAYASGPATDPKQPASPSHSRVWRGGAWGDNPDLLRSGYRNVSGAHTAQPGIGLRCILLPLETGN